MVKLNDWIYRFPVLAGVEVMKADLHSGYDGVRRVRHIAGNRAVEALGMHTGSHSQQEHQKSKGAHSWDSSSFQESDGPCRHAPTHVLNSLWPAEYIDRLLACGISVCFVCPSARC